MQWRSLLRDFPPDPASLPLTGCVPVQQAGRGTSHFFHNHPTPPSTSDTESTEVQTPTKSYFTAITAWRSVDAMREWYTDFASQCGDYERLGHKIDKIRMFIEDLDAVDSQVLDMVGDTYEVTKRPLPRFWASDQVPHAFKRSS